MCGGQGIAAVARELVLIERTLRNWVKAAKVGTFNPGAGHINPGQMEFSRVGAENAQRLRRLLPLRPAAGGRGR